MKMKLLVMVFVAMVGLVGFQSAVFAAQDECPDLVATNEQTNAKFMSEGIALSEEALELAKQGQGKETKAKTKAAMMKFKCIVTTTGESQLQKPKARIKMGGIKAGKGDTEAGAALIAEGLELFKKVNLTPKGLGD